MTIIISHGDGDGLCSAALVKMVPSLRTAQVYISHPMGLAKDLAGIEEDLVILDIAVDERAYKDVYILLENISDSYNVVYIDHHQLPGPLPANVELVNFENACTSELAYRYYYDKLPEYAKRFACIGAICDYMDDSIFISELLHEYERRTLFLDAGFLAQGLSGISRNYDEMRALIQKFSEGLYPCEIKKLVDAAIKVTKQDKKDRKRILQFIQIGKHIAWVIDPNASKSKSAHWIMAASSKMIGLTINLYNSRKQIADISIRGRNLVDLRNIVPKIARELGGSGGGHANAIGCRIPRNKLNTFLDKIDSELDRLNIPNPKTIDELVKLL